MIGEFESHGVALFIPGQGIDTRSANPAGRLQMHILMAMADFERSLISERTKLKLHALRRSGKHIGRPKMPASVQKSAETHFERICGETGRPPSCRGLAKHLGVSIGTAHRLRSEMMKRKPKTLNLATQVSEGGKNEIRN
jgi:DNA invertase Pin-like site-specific DNA recombinase